MSIGEAADKYEVDGAQIWEWISIGSVLPNGVRLVALPEEREGTKWVVREEQA